jgi:hypothetical protein
MRPEKESTMSGWLGSKIRIRRFDQDGGVAAAAERMLSGGAVGLFRDAGYSYAPSWAYLNRLGHCEFEQMVALAEAVDRGRPGGWGATLGYIAAELLTFEKTPDQIHRAQREVLIPLELDILDGQIPDPETPAEFMSLIIGALDHHRTWRP